MNLLLPLRMYVQAILASRSRVFHKMLYQPPSPQQPVNQRGKKDKDSQRETNKLRLFLKRSSEPLLNLQNAAQQVCTISSSPSLS